MAGVAVTVLVGVFVGVFVPGGNDVLVGLGVFVGVFVGVLVAVLPGVGVLVLVGQTRVMAALAETAWLTQLTDAVLGRTPQYSVLSM